MENAVADCAVSEASKQTAGGTSKRPQPYRDLYPPSSLSQAANLGHPRSQRTRIGIMDGLACG